MRRYISLLLFIGLAFFGCAPRITYEGERNQDGKRHGQGTQTWANGQKYVGEFKDNKLTGQGTYIFGKGQWEGDKYVGEFKDDLRNGQGTYTFSNGSKYVGEFKDGKRNGQGTYTWADGSKYVGEYKDNLYDGQGTYTFSNGEKYVGEYKDGKRNGQGTYTWADGSKYVGEYKDDKLNGKGVGYLVNGEIQSGTWINDIFQKNWTIEAVDNFLRNKYPQFKGLNYSTPITSVSLQRIEGCIINLLNGEQIEGDVIEVVPNQYIVVRTEGSGQKRISYAHIDYILHNNNDLADYLQEAGKEPEPEPPKPGIVTIIVDPPKTNILVGDRQYKANVDGIASIELPVGRHKIDFRSKGYEPVTKNVIVLANEKKFLEIQLYLHKAKEEAHTSALDRLAELSVDGHQVPEKFMLHNNYPNPFYPITTIRYDLPEDALVNITIFNMNGIIVSNLVSSQQNAGYKSIEWNATNNQGLKVPSGMYIYTIQAGEFTQLKKMLLIE